MYDNFFYRENSRFYKSVYLRYLRAVRVVEIFGFDKSMRRTDKSNYTEENDKIGFHTMLLKINGFNRAK